MYKVLIFALIFCQRTVLHDNIFYLETFLSNLRVHCIDKCIPCDIYSLSRGLTFDLFPPVCFTVSQRLDDESWEKVCECGGSSHASF